jgi:protein TonB
LLQPSPVPAIPFAERLRTGAGSRTLGIGLALLVEALLLLLLLTLGAGDLPGDKAGNSITVMTLKAEAASEEAPKQSKPEREQRTEERPVPQRRETEEPPPRPAETAPAMIPTPLAQPPAAKISPNPVRPAPSGRPVYGPPDSGGSSPRDTERVGTAPNGEPLYAAAWYREPRDDELSGYLSTARGPGWGLIACRTAPDYRVEDCVGLAEYPQGSQINRAVLAAAWQFKVRPPRLGGQPLVGSWVRIRIDYGIERR